MTYVDNQCYYCGQEFEIRTDLYEHLATHTKRSDEKVIKNETNIADEEMTQDNKTVVVSENHADISSIRKQIDEIQKRIKSA